MYLSQLTLNPRSAQVRSELARPYEMHRTLSKAFPSNSFHQTRDEEDAAGVLFRVEQNAREGLIRVLVQSQAAPTWKDLGDLRDARGHAYLLEPARTKTFELQLNTGQMLAFRLRANPTKRLGKTAGAKKGKRVGIYDEQGQLKWLAGKANAGGFRLVRAQLSRDEHIEDKPKAGDTRAALELWAVQFDGILQIVNDAEFLKTVARGIGSGKAFGFGLLSLARA